MLTDAASPERHFPCSHPCAAADLVMVSADTESRLLPFFHQIDAAIGQVDTTTEFFPQQIDTGIEPFLHPASASADQIKAATKLSPHLINVTIQLFSHLINAAVERCPHVINAGIERCFRI